MYIADHIQPLDPDSSTTQSIYYSNKPELFDRYGKFKSDTNKFRDVIDVPEIRWKPEYEKDPKLFLIKLQQVSDYMLFNDSSMFGSHNPNSHSLLNIMNKKSDKKDYERAKFLYGAEDPIPYKDFNFFYSAKARCVGEVASRPFNFHTKSVNFEFNEKMRKETSKLGAKQMMSLIAEYATEDLGIDLSFLIDEAFNSHLHIDEVLSNLNIQQRVEYILDKLIKDTQYKHNLKDLARKCYSDKFDVNAEFAFIDVDDTYDIPEVIPRYISPNQVRFISTRPDRKIETLDDPSVIAASVLDHININQIISKYGRKYLTSGTGIRGLTEAVNMITNHNNWGRYDPKRAYFVEYYNSNGFRSDNNHPMRDETGKYYGEYDTFQRVDYMKNLFYPGSVVGEGLTFSVLEQKMFFKVLKDRRYIAEVNGKPASKSVIDKWRKNKDFSKQIICDFRELGDDEKVPEGYYPVNSYKEELWSATRLGHGALLDIGPYKWYQPKEGQRDAVKIPIASVISYDKSFTAIGQEFFHTVSVAWNKVDSIMYTLGNHSSAVVIDKALGMDAASFLFNARKLGVAEVDSSKALGGGNDLLSSKILTHIPLGNQIAEVIRLMEFIGFIMDMYQTMIGLGRGVQGAASPYENASNLNMNIANQNIMRAGSEFEHDMFLRQVFQKTGDIKKNIIAKYKGKGGQYSVLLSNGEVEMLEIIEDLSLAEMNVHLYNGFDERQKAERLRAFAEQMASTGSVDFKTIAEIIYADNPMDYMAIINRNADIIEKRRQEDQKIQMANIQQRAESDQMKVQVPIQVQRIKSDTDITLQQMQSEDRDVRDLEKGNREFYKAEQKFKEKLLDADIRSAERDDDVNVQEQLKLQDAAIEQLFNILGVNKNGNKN